MIHLLSLLMTHLHQERPVVRNKLLALLHPRSLVSKTEYAILLFLAYILLQTMEIWSYLLLSVLCTFCVQVLTLEHTCWILIPNLLMLTYFGVYMRTGRSVYSSSYISIYNGQKDASLICTVEYLGYLFTCTFLVWKAWSLLRRYHQDL